MARKVAADGQYRWHDEKFASQLGLAPQFDLASNAASPVFICDEYHEICRSGSGLVMDEHARLRAQLQSTDCQQRATATEQLCQAGPDAAWAAVDLVVASGDEPLVREWAVEALEMLGPPPVEAQPQLTELVDSSMPLQAYWAVTLLGRLGALAKSSQPALVSVLTTSPDPATRERAAWALGEIGASSNDARAALEKAAKSGEPRLARLATTALQQLKP